MPSPVIGITLDHETNESYAKYPWYAIRENYAQSVLKFGATPIMLPYGLGHEEAYLDIIDGLIITGGNFDIDPAIYNEGINSETVTLKSNRTQFEFSIAKLAIEKDIPVLGICGGEQLINVVQGGSLVQHIPDSYDTDIDHEQKIPKHLSSHEVEVVEGTLLHKITGKQRFLVNSTHHQAVKNLGKDMQLSAKAPDGVIEAIEHKTHKFCLGVEWHPEYLTTDEDHKIYDAFIRACHG